MLHEVKTIGTFEVTSGKVYVTDPCCNEDIIQENVLEVANGTWIAKAIYDGGTCMELVAFLEGYDKATPRDVAPFEVDVDSGQAGIFDVASYKKDELVNEPIWFYPEDPWYSLCCQKTLSNDKAGIIPGGAVASSGYGDGSYKAFTYEKDGKIVSIVIDFGDTF